MGPDGKPMTGEGGGVLGPDGKVMIGPDGKPLKNPSWAPPADKIDANGTSEHKPNRTRPNPDPIHTQSRPNQDPIQTQTRPKPDPNQIFKIYSVYFRFSQIIFQKLFTLFFLNFS